MIKDPVRAVKEKAGQCQLMKQEDSFVYCTNCGDKSIEGDIFCKKCGTPLTVPTGAALRNTLPPGITPDHPIAPNIVHHGFAAPGSTPSNAAHSSAAQPYAAQHNTLQPNTAQPRTAQHNTVQPNTAQPYAAQPYAASPYSNPQPVTQKPKPVQDGKSKFMPILIASVSVVTVALIAVALYFAFGAGKSNRTDTQNSGTPPSDAEEVVVSTDDVRDSTPDSGSEPDPAATLPPEEVVQDEADNNESDTGTDESIQWLSYMMSIDIVAEEPPGANTTPEGRFVHVILTYISDDDELGGFLFEDLMDKSDFILTDASGNVYEHLGMISPVSLNMSGDGGFGADEIQEISGVYFDIPLETQLSDLVFSVRD